MTDTFIQIKEGICQLFSEAEDMELTLDTTLEELPDWDSMAAVNLQSYLEQEFRVAIGLDKLDEETSLGELVDHIKNPQPLAVNQ
ncbi:MAG: acyl carrier protein [Desulfobacterales bacterium]|jgi:acyl carrier protein